MTGKTLLTSIAFVLISLACAEYDVAKYCQLVQKGAKLPSMESCETYYTCNGHDQFVREICSPGLEFSKNDQGCVPKSQSNCFYGLANTCYNKNKQFAPSAKGCNWYCWCENGQIAAEGTCNFGEIFYAANSTCINGRCDNSPQAGGVQNLCDIMQDGKYFGDFSDCGAWHMCNAMTMQNGLCEHPLVFDTATGWCLANNGDMCQRTNNIIKNQASGPPKEACTSIDQVVGDTNLCSIYYKCRRATNTPDNVYEWVQQTCDNQFYDVISKQCTSTALARAYPGCDRCQFKSGNPYWANAVDSTCSKYITCNNGQKVGTTLGSCPDGHYYDEAMQVCIDGSFTLDKYTKQNGACQDYTCTAERVCSTPEENNKPAKPDVPAETDPAKPDVPAETDPTKPDESGAHNGTDNTQKEPEGGQKPADKQ